MRSDHTFKGPDGEFHYIDWGGSGPLAHISHATGLCAGTYSPLAKRLKSKLRIVGMDDRGHGNSTAPADPHKLKTWDLFVDDLEGFFESLHEPVIAIGHSRGGVTSLVLAVKRPELIRAVILIDPSIIPLFWTLPLFLARKLGLTRFIPMVAQAGRRKNVWPDRETLFDAYRNKGAFRTWDEEFLKAYIADGTEETPDGSFKLCCEPLWEQQTFASCLHDMWRYIPLIRQPTLLLYGANSYAFLPSAVKRFKANFPDATFRCYSENGHFLPMERPDDTVKTIITFLKEKKII
ncbi:alpha/beta fold hydrolase [Thermodesulfobacteriota bacterium]